MPRISFRAMMVATVLAAILAATAKGAGDGVVLLKAILATVSLALLFFVFAGLAFLVAWIVARLVHGQAKDFLEGSPFAEGNLPPQQIRPRDPGQP